MTVAKQKNSLFATSFLSLKLRKFQCFFSDVYVTCFQNFKVRGHLLTLVIEERSQRIQVAFDDALHNVLFDCAAVARHVGQCHL